MAKFAETYEDQNNGIRKYSDLPIKDIGPLTSLQAKAQKILRSAANFRGMPQTAGTPVVITVGAANTASTLDTAQTTAFGSGQIQMGTDTRLEQIGKWGTVGSNYQGIISSVASGSKRGMHGQGFRFGFDGQILEFTLQAGSGDTFIIYQTELTGANAGIRQRSIANDQATPDASQRYYSCDFGSRAPRIIELYFPTTASVRGMNITATGVAIPVCSVWNARRPDALNLAFVWDSYGNNAANGAAGGGATNSQKIWPPDVFGEVLGQPNPIVLANGGTGFLNPGSTNGTYGTRMSNGDIDVSNVGNLDLLVVPCSVNDNLAVNAAYTDTAHATAVYDYFASAKLRQPNPIIVSWGPQVTGSATGGYVASRFSTAREAFLRAADGDPRFIWLDNSATGENWLAGAAATGTVGQYCGTDTVHPNTAGALYWGIRPATSLLTALYPLAAA
jgi:hypothetical protein